MTFWREVFSDNGTPSASRILMLVHSLGAIALMGNFSYHSHGAIPDLGTITALGGWATAPYIVNRVTQPKTNGADAGAGK
jgi:hypothetical protein